VSPQESKLLEKRRLGMGSTVMGEGWMRELEFGNCWALETLRREI
jgi:hypothetical protein